MKVYFDATPSRYEEYKQNYWLAGKVIEQLGHELTSRWILDFNDSFFRLSKDQWKNHYIRIRSSLEAADVAVFDTSVSSTSIGQLIQHAFVLGKPVVALCDTAVHPNIFLEGAGEVESKVLVAKYSLATLPKVLKESLEYVQEWLGSRFTMIVDGKIRRHLDEVAKRGVNRSEYIRKLIEQNMERK